MTRSHLLVCTLLLVAQHSSHAQINKCTVDGKVVYQQEPCAVRGGTGAPLRVFPTGGSEAVNRDSEQGTGMPWDNAPEVKLERLSLTREEAAKIFAIWRRALVVSLKDPASAIFDDVRILKVKHAGEEGTYICGMINAKNSYGAYTGSEAFFFDGVTMGITSGRFSRAKKVGGIWYKIRNVSTECLLRGTDAAP